MRSWLFALSMFGLAAGCEGRLNSHIDAGPRLSNGAKQCLERLEYFTDGRGNCFAYCDVYFGAANWATGGPALATVPCHTVPAQ